MTVYVDDREPITYREMFDKTIRMEKGDYLIVANGQKQVFERKTIPDFYHSLQTGRLNEQSWNVDGVLLEYRWIPRKLNWARLYDSINGFNAHGPPIFWVHTPIHLRDTLRRIEQKMRDGLWGTMRRPVVINTMNVEHKGVGLLASYPGIGETRAVRILQVYGTYRKAMESFEKWPDEVHGIGPKTVQTIRDKVLDLPFPGTT